MSDISLMFVFAAGVMSMKEAWDYKNKRVRNRYVEVNRLENLDAFCLYASRHSAINGIMIFVLFGIIVASEYFSMSFNFVVYFGLVAAVLVRAFQFPRSFERFYRPKEMPEESTDVEIIESDMEEHIDE